MGCSIDSDEASGSCGEHRVMTSTLDLGLDGKTILITGASSGIGKATARQLASGGARVILSGRNLDALNALRDELPDHRHVVSPCALDSADNAYDWIVGLQAEVGMLQGVFHCAGLELVRPIKMTKQAQLDEILGSTLFAAFGIARALTRRDALADGSSIVMMSSVAALTGQIGMTAYSAAKASIDGMVRSLACELAGRRIRVNAVAAGAVQTEMHDRLVRSLGEEAVAVYERAHLLGFGAPDDISNAVTFLLSDASRWITGTTMVVDGGYTAR